MKMAEIKRGQPITFRIPADTPDHIVKHLQYLKETEKRNFSSKIAEFVMTGMTQSLAEHQEVLHLPLPRRLSKAQRDWLKHEQSQALLGSIIHQLLSDPLRVASLLSSLNNDIINEDYYSMPLEEAAGTTDLVARPLMQDEEEVETIKQPLNIIDDDDLDEIDWGTEVQVDSSVEEETVNESLDDLLGDFLAQMNK
ncbi:hypothetical protein [Metabacillus fastidiosus]|uniref:hypothetical protein n=1 Tax=Metabacillus fastidiosus TaxID=1458 RepID=UPI002E1E2F25|nr:hypothetical protein [Metabacillus fastidiosus]